MQIGRGGFELSFVGMTVSMRSDSATSHYGIPYTKVWLNHLFFLPPCSNSFFNIVTIFNDLLLPSVVMTAVPRHSVIYHPHSTRINQHHHYRVLNKYSMTYFYFLDDDQQAKPMYYRNPILDGSALVLSSSNGKYH